MRKLLRPQVLIPAVISLSLVAGLLSVADLGQVLQIMEGYQRSYLLFFLLLMVLYETVRGVQWQFLLRSLGIKAPLDAVAFSFVLGEIARPIPVGNYFQNYLLSRVEGEDFGQTSSATTLIVLTEVGLSCLGVLALGVGTWTWIRPLILLGTPVALLIGWLGYTVLHHADTPDWLKQHAVVQKVRQEFHAFRQGTACLLRVQVLAIQVPLCACYLLTAGTALYVALRGLGITNGSFPEVLAVYLFSLAFGLIVPLPTDIGVTEVSGVGAFEADGLERNSALSAMLVNRILSFGSALAIAVLSAPFLLGEWRRALSGGSRRLRSSRSPERRSTDSPEETGTGPTGTGSSGGAAGPNPQEAALSPSLGSPG